MRISKLVIELVLSGGGTEEEKNKVAKFFREYPDELAQYMTEENWDEFRPDLGWEAPKEKMLASIGEGIGEVPVRSMSKERSRRNRVIWIAAAAVVLLAAPLLVLFKNKKITDKREEIMVFASRPAKPEWRTISNASLKPQIYTLPDGSKAKLAGNSHIRFEFPYVDRRDIYLEGEGTFTVAPDKAKPFAVHSGPLVTTALGTVFKVSNKGRGVTSVRLYSGRVVVAGNSFSNVYLQPGQELRLNNSRLAIEIRKEESKIAAVAVVEKPKPIVLNFVKEPLTEIFNQLQQQYGVSISYADVNLQNADFTGVFDNSKESLESFLTTLCDLNGLKLNKQQDKGFTIQTN